LDNGQYCDDQKSTDEILDSAVCDRKLGQFLVVLILMLNQNVLARADLSPKMIVGRFVRHGEDLDEGPCHISSSP
jgi:hypothetical protein